MVFHQPIWKICWKSSPNFGVENQEYVKPPPSCTPQKSNELIPTIALFKGSYPFQPIILGILVSFRRCKLLITMVVSKSPFSRGCGTPSKVAKKMAYKCMSVQAAHSSKYTPGWKQKWRSPLPKGGITPLKTNIEPGNHPVEKENHLPNLHFLGSMLVFRGVIHPRFNGVVILYQYILSRWRLSHILNEPPKNSGQFLEADLSEL